jgi:hypothetical protein
VLRCLLYLSGREGGLAAEISGWTVEGGWMLRCDRPSCSIIIITTARFGVFGSQIVCDFLKYFEKKNNILNYFLNNFNVLILKIKLNKKIKIILIYFEVKIFLKNII